MERPLPATLLLLLLSSQLASAVHNHYDHYYYGYFYPCHNNLRLQYDSYYYQDCDLAAARWGGGVANEKGTMLITGETTIVNNSAVEGGGASNYEGSLKSRANMTITGSWEGGSGEH